MLLYPEEEVNYGMCEDCFNEYLKSNEEMKVKKSLKKKK